MNESARSNPFRKLIEVRNLRGKPPLASRACHLNSIEFNFIALGVLYYDPSRVPVTVRSSYGDRHKPFCPSRMDSGDGATWMRENHGRQENCRLVASSWETMPRILYR